MSAWLPPQELQRRFALAQQLLGANRVTEARAQLAPVVDAAPREPAVRQLMAQVLSQMDDLAGAERELRAALAVAPRVAPLHMQLGVVLAHIGRDAEAEAALRAAVAADRKFPPAAAALAEFLTTHGRALEAVRLLEPLHRVKEPAVAAAHGAALKALGRTAEAIVQSERSRDLEPQNGVAWHNLAAAYGDLQRFTLAEAATAKAQALGIDAPETWLVRGRALWGLDRLDEAQAAFEHAIRRRPFYADAHRELAQLIWMRTGDLAAATRQYKAALKARPGDQPMIVDHARVLQFGGDLAGADRALAAMAEHPDAQPLLKGAAAQVAVKFDPDRAARYALEAVAAKPGDDDLLRTLCEVRLAQGDARDASRIAEDLVARDPLDQGNLMLQGTAWRLAGDPRHRAGADYDALVRARIIDAPPGWPNLAAYLADLTAALERMHVMRTHPIGQSLRGGTQTNQNLLESEDPAVKAFPQAVDGAIRAYLAALGRGDDPVRRRNTGKYRFSGIWSVRLKGQGYHVDHLHPEGWLSSACYIAVPPVVEAGGHEGWIKFGEPGIPTRPPLAAERFEKPEPGKLVLFPSYMWHGTAPFSGEVPRLTVAFDLVPA